MSYYVCTRLGINYYFFRCVIVALSIFLYFLRHLCIGGQVFGISICICVYLPMYETS